MALKSYDVYVKVLKVVTVKAKDFEQAKVRALAEIEEETGVEGWEAVEVEVR